MGARYFMAIAFTITFCFIMAMLSVALLCKLIAVETYVALMASFVLIVREITEAYFKREDRGKGVPTP